MTLSTHVVIAHARLESFFSLYVNLAMTGLVKNGPRRWLMLIYRECGFFFGREVFQQTAELHDKGYKMWNETWLMKRGVEDLQRCLCAPNYGHVRSDDLGSVLYLFEVCRLNQWPGKSKLGNGIYLRASGFGAYWIWLRSFLNNVLLLTDIKNVIGKNLPSKLWNLINVQ